jgi:hypothetical protein
MIPGSRALCPAFGPLLLLSLLLVGCGVKLPVGEMRTIQHQIETGSATTGRVRLIMTVGELELLPGGKALLDATIATNVEGWLPEVKAAPRDGVQEVTIRQPEGNAGSGAKNRWDVLVGAHVPLDLEVTCGVGEASLDLRGIELSRLEVTLGVGDVVVDVSGERAGSFEGSVTGGTGMTTVRLPRDLGVRVKAERGIGTISTEGLRKTDKGYVNDAWGESETSIDLEVTVGVGSVRLEVK